ncbi:MAG: TIGR03618 family F420-dependent PPOX class oxidoreductase [Dehalococcoidia bacterium]
MATLTPEQEAFLRDHRLGVLATGRKDGSPQASTIMYVYHDGEVIISVTEDRAKWVNAIRQPKVALVVLDGRKQLVLYGNARGVEADPDRLLFHKRIREAMNRPVEDEAEYLDLLDKQKRVILAISPTKVLMNE